MNNNWIKFSDCKPTEADLPYWAAGGLPDPAPNIINHPYGHAESRTHWQRATAPEPPPRELTQREKDGGAFFEWLEESDDTSPQTIWHAGIAYERSLPAAPPPPKEPTQLEKDDEACDQWNNCAQGFITYRQTWHAAIAYVRATKEEAL